MDVSQVRRVAIDETSRSRGHQYITLFVDVDTKRLMFAVEGKGAEGLLTFRSILSERGVATEPIKESGCDMSSSFISGIGLLSIGLTEKERLFKMLQLRRLPFVGGYYTQLLNECDYGYSGLQYIGLPTSMVTTTVGSPIAIAKKPEL